MKKNTLMKVKSLFYFFIVLNIILVGCSKKESLTSSNYEVQRQRSLELENPVNHEAVTASVNDEVAAEPLVSGKSVITSVPSEAKSATPVIPAVSEKELKKVEKLKKMIERKAAKRIEKAEKKGATNINQNIKLGLILVIAGILIAVILGSLIHGLFGALGAIVAIIGLVFLILGLLEM